MVGRDELVKHEDDHDNSYRHNRQRQQREVHPVPALEVVRQPVDNHAEAKSRACTYSAESHRRMDEVNYQAMSEVIQNVL